MNIQNYNKNNYIYHKNNYIKNTKDNYNTNNNIFYINTLSYKRNNNIYNTYYYIKKTEEYYNIILSQPQLHVALGQTPRKCRSAQALGVLTWWGGLG